MAKYDATFFDYYGWEFRDMTKTFNTFKKAKEYFNKVCYENAIPFAQLCRDGNAISLSTGHEIGGECDSRRY